MNKVKNIDIPNNALLVTADVVGLYPGIPHEAGLEALRNASENRSYQKYQLKTLLKWQSFC